MKPRPPRGPSRYLLTPAQCAHIAQRADAGEPLLNLLREYDLSRAAFYALYFKTRGVRWSQVHPRERAHTGTNRATVSGYARYANLMRGGQWHGTPKQLIAYLNELERAQ